MQTPGGDLASQEKLELEELRAQDGDDEGDTEQSTGGSEKRRLFRFKPRFDVVLVREVIRWFPWAAGYGRTRSAWMSVAAAVQSQLETQEGVSFSKGGALDHAIVKRRVDMLLDAFRKREMAGLRGAGSPTEFDLRNKLLGILMRVVDEQTLNKGAMREKRVQQALEVARHSLSELDAESGLAPPGVPTLSPGQAGLMAIAPAPLTASTSAKQQNGGGTKRGARATAAAAAAAAAKRPRADKSSPPRAATTEPLLELRERKLRVAERQIALEEQRLVWERQKAAESAKERQALMDVLQGQTQLMAELLAQLRGGAKFPQ